MIRKYCHIFLYLQRRSHSFWGIFFFIYREKITVLGRSKGINWNLESPELQTFKVRLWTLKQKEWVIYSRCRGPKMMTIGGYRGWFFFSFLSGIFVYLFFLFYYFLNIIIIIIWFEFDKDFNNYNFRPGQAIRFMFKSNCHIFI